MKNLLIVNFEGLLAVGLLVLGSIFLWHMGAEYIPMTIKGQRQIMIKRTTWTFAKMLFRLSFGLSWLGTIKRHRVCHGKISKGSLTIFTVSFLLFLNSGGLFRLVPQANIWKFETVHRIPNLEFTPKIGQHIAIISFGWSQAHPLVSVWFYAVYVPIGLAALNRLAVNLFPYAELARLVEKAVLADKDLPDEYRSVVQISPNQVIVDYRGSPVDPTVFVVHKRKLAEAVGYEVEVTPNSRYGSVLVTFKSPYRNDPSGWQASEHGLKKSNDKQDYVYMLFTGEYTEDGQRVIKGGRCNDPDKTLSSYKRGLRNPHWLFALPFTEKLNEKSLFAKFKDFKLPRTSDDDSGEFFVEGDDGFYEIVDELFISYPQETLSGKPYKISQEIWERGRDVLRV